MKYLSALIISLTPVVGLNAEDNEWSYIGKDTNNAVFYVRTGDVLKGRPNQTSAKAWVKIDHSKDATTSFREGRTLFEINCPAQTYKILTIIGHYPDGKSLSDTPIYAPTKHVIPDSLIEDAVKLVCADMPE